MEKMHSSNDLPFCSMHQKPLTSICFSQCNVRENPCTNRLLCGNCSHSNSHLKSTFKINDLLATDFSLSFFQLFFTLPQIKSLYVPLQINTIEIITVLDSLLLPFKNNPKKSPVELSLEQDLLSIESICKRINDLIHRIHIQFNDKYDWSAVESLIKLFAKGIIGQEQTNLLLSETIEWIQGALKFVKNFYIIEISNIRELLEKNKLPHQIGKLFKEIKQELFSNMNYIRSLFISSQPQYMTASSQNIRPPFITTFPLKSKRLPLTISMIPSKSIKLSLHNQLIIIKKYECQIIQMAAITSLNQISSIMYTQTELVDATVSHTDDTQVALLFNEGLIQFYKIKPSVSIFEHEILFEMQFNASDLFSSLNFVIPQKPNYKRLQLEQQGEQECNLVNRYVFDYIALTTESQISIVETIEGQIVEEFQNSNQFKKFFFECGNKEESTEDQKIVSEEQDQNAIICFHSDKQIDSIHSLNQDIFINQNIIHIAFSNILKHFVYATSSDLIILLNQSQNQISQDSEHFRVKYPFKEVDSKQIMCMDFTSDHNYLFLLLNSSYICFFHSLDKYNLEFETYLFKTGLIIGAVFTKISNTILILHSDSTIYQVNLSSTLNFC